MNDPVRHYWQIRLHDFFASGNCGYEVIRADEPKVSPTEKFERRRQALLVDMYFSGVNAVTGEGHLVNLDMIGNRIAAMTFGPRERHSPGVAQQGCPGSQIRHAADQRICRSGQCHAS